MLRGRATAIGAVIVTAALGGSALAATAFHPKAGKYIGKASASAANGYPIAIVVSHGKSAALVPRFPVTRYCRDAVPLDYAVDVHFKATPISRTGHFRKTEVLRPAESGVPTVKMALSGTFHRDGTVSGELDLWSATDASCHGVFTVLAKR